MQYLLSKEELQTNFTIPDFVLKTQRQIAKDFELSGQHFHEDFLHTELSLDAIIAQMVPLLENISRTGETKLLQLLYQIDIPQKEFLSMLNSPNFIPELARLIIRREAYKVFLRTKF